MKNYLVIDLETTGLNHEIEQIIEVALIKYDQHFNEVGSFNTLVKLQYGRPLPEFITELTGITEEMTKEGMYEYDAMRVVESFIDEDTIVVAQYAPFDLAFLDTRGDIQVDNFICTKSLTAQVEPNESSSLKPTCERLGIPLDDAHRAFADVKATAELLQYRLKEHKAQYIQNVVVTSPDRPLKYVPGCLRAVIDKGEFEWNF